MDTAMIVWLVVLVVFLGAELATVSLVSVWLAVGALFALISTFFGAAPLVQIIIFLGTSALALVLTRPFARKIQSVRVSTNADRNVGGIAVVTEDIDNLAGKGAVHIDGKEWTARAENDEPVAKGASVIVLRIEGVKLIVSPMKKTASV